MNTGFLGPAVATVLTVYGIETIVAFELTFYKLLQQCLPFTVLKLKNYNPTVTDYTISCNSAYRLRY